jgi:O-antigen/teichoic acid export membrane protein
MTRALEYRKLIIPQAGSALAIALISITLALNGFGYWSIVAANLAGAIVSVILLNIVKPIRIRLAFEKVAALQMLNFGGTVFLSSIVAFLIFNADNFIIGSVRGSAVLGYYAIAFNWGAITSVKLYEIVHRVLLPTFSDMARGGNTLRSAYLKVLEFISFVSLLANLCLLAVSREFLFFIAGSGTEKWFPALAVFRILCIYGTVRALLEPIGNVVIASGRPKVLLRAILFSGVIELALLYPALKYAGIEGVAVLITITYALQYLVYMPFLKRHIGIEYGEILRTLQPAITSAVCTYMINLVLQSFLPFSILGLMIKFFATAGIYLVIYGSITRWRLIKESVSLIRTALRTPGMV